MRLLHLIGLLACALAALAEDDAKSRDKRQHLPFHPRRSGRPPPYAVQMEPIAHYSQRDPLYRPLVAADSKSDELPGHYEDSPYNYYPTEPEPIIEIIIKESNESLPTPVPPPPPPTQKPRKEPIQVFYVKYEKKQELGEDKPRVVYDTPIPALTPVEEHEVVHPEGEEESDPGYLEASALVTPSPPEPSTTLRAIIKPDSEVYHAGSSGLRVTFNTEQVPPNNHKKRSDKDAPVEQAASKPTALPPPGSSKRPHGPFAPIQPVPPARITPAFPPQRILTQFGQQQQLGPPQQPGPPNFIPTQYHQAVPAHVRNQYQPGHLVQRPQQRLPITIQGLPGPQQRLPFNSFAPAHRLNVNHPQQPGVPGSLSHSHQNVHVQNLPNQQQLANFHFDPQLQYNREQEKQRFFEEQRLQEQKRQQEQYRILEQRRKQEHEQKLRLQQQQQQQYQAQIQQQKYQQPPRQQQPQQPFKFSQPAPAQPQPQQNQVGGEILRAIPKLEQHYAIRENPLHPGPFPPNQQIADLPQYNSNQFARPAQSQTPQPQAPIAQANSKLNLIRQPPQQIHQSQQQPIFQNQQSFFLQNLPPPQQQRPQSSPGPVPPQQSPWARPVFSTKNALDNQQIFATPESKLDDDSRKFASTPNSLRYSATPRPTTRSPMLTTTATTTTTTEATTTLSPKQEAKVRQNIANLPDEVPDDIREQLLSSGILGNADIQILDYDKVGGINVGDLPPEALANFYGAGGAAATGAASEPVPQRVKRPKAAEARDEVQVAAPSSGLGRNALASGAATDDELTEEVTLRPGGVEMKVVRFDPSTAQGQSIVDRQIVESATRLQPVSVGAGEQEPTGDPGQYNRYLPLKVSGASFPIPDAPELRGRRIASVVVLAPVEHSGGDQPEQEQSRLSRKVAGDGQAVRFLAGDSLKQLVKKPTAENYKRWLDQERQTEPQRQSVVLLVTTASQDSEAEKEIFMYDVTSETVSKLAGDLSTAFVDAAESNSDTKEDPTLAS